MFKQMKNAKLWLIAIMVVSCSGCLSIPLASPELDQIAKEFAPPANTSYIYVMRYWAFVGAGAWSVVQLQESIDNVTYKRASAFLPTRTYVLFEVPPSHYEIGIDFVPGRSKEGVRWSPISQMIHKIKLVALPGHMYFIAFKVWGYTQLELELLPKDVGKKAIMNYERVVSSSLE